MLLSLGLGGMCMFLSGMDLQRILEEGRDTPKYVYVGCAFAFIVGVVNLIAAYGHSVV